MEVRLTSLDLSKTNAQSDSSIDDDAVVIIWNLTTGETTQRIDCAYHGPISAIVWIHINDSTEPAFVFGCADGSLHLYKKKMGGVRESVFSKCGAGHSPFL